MTNEIMINGVDVSGCPHLDDCPEIWGEFPECYLDSYECDTSPNCLYKQLARKTEECERLKNIKDDYFNQLEIAHQAVQDKNNIIEKFEKKLQTEKQKVKKYKQALKEITDICDNVISFGLVGLHFEEVERICKEVLDD